MTSSSESDGVSIIEEQRDLSPSSTSTDSEHFVEERMPRTRQQAQLFMRQSNSRGTDHDYAGRASTSRDGRRTRRRVTPVAVSQQEPEQPANLVEDPLHLQEENEEISDAIEAQPESETDVEEIQQNDNPDNLVMIPLPPVLEYVHPNFHTQSKKRKYSAEAEVAEPTIPEPTPRTVNDDEDDGLTCPICFEHWDMSGAHRLVSLRCGHLFGEKCIRRWLAESVKQSGVKACPQCKAKATVKDIRWLYAKRLCCIDRTGEDALRDQLNAERKRIAEMSSEREALVTANKFFLTQMNSFKSEVERMRENLSSWACPYCATTDSTPDLQQQTRQKQYKMYLEGSIELCREPGCRIVIHSNNMSSLIVSQKSSQNHVFPGYGLRFIDMPTFLPTRFLHASTKIIRDICLSADEEMVAVCSMEPRCKLFDLRTSNRPALILGPLNKPLWSCDMGRHERQNLAYLGAQHGSVYVYDVRNAGCNLEEIVIAADCSPVINIVSVPVSTLFPGGGFLVCKLQTLWFYEYAHCSTNYTTAVPTKLDIDGPFMAMNFDMRHNTLLITARNSTRYPLMRFIFGKLDKVGPMTVFDIKTTFLGSSQTPVMTRSTQIAVHLNTLIVGYYQDSKHLALFDTYRKSRVQSLPVQDVVYDVCPVYTSTTKYLAAITENKCRMYKIEPQYD